MCQTLGWETGCLPEALVPPCGRALDRRIDVTLEEELLSHLDRSIPQGDTKERNKALIVFFNGFGDDPCPTLEETARRFDIGTRERVRQIIAAKFRDRTSVRDLPELRRCAKHVASSPYWLGSELVASVVRNGWAVSGINLRGALNLMQSLGLCAGYELYDSRVKPLTRAALEATEDFFVLSRDAVEPLREAVLEARKLPGKIGLADISYLSGTPDSRERVLAALRMDPDAWIGVVKGRTWYCYEDRENPLVNACEKVFGIADRVEVGRLSACLANYLRGRSRVQELPGEEEIERYVRGSRFFVCDANHARFTGDTTDITEIEREVVSYLKRRPSSSYVALSEHLTAKGYGKPIIDKAVVTSALVHVDKSKGRTHYSYSLVSRGDLAKAAPSPKDGRYAAFAARLKRIECVGTDGSVETSTRREQAILSEWLFDGKASACCALCGKEYGTSALVTAHKKRRSLCNETERLDPYVVMPLCLFGCDYLYERRLVTIEGGVVRGHPSRQAGVEERRVIARLEGRTVLAEWIKGDPSYFV
jgi:hypothetical protein